MSHGLLEAWRTFSIEDRPLLLGIDKPYLQDLERQPGVSIYRSLEEYTASSDFGTAGDRRLHLGLCPVPFLGPVETASIYLLMLNPGLSPAVYFAEWGLPSYTAAAEENLSGQGLFQGLDLRLAGHPGFDYWHRKFAAVVRDVAEATGHRYRAVLEFVAGRVCALQALPYFSSSFGVSAQMLETLPSCQLVKGFVRESVVPRARTGEALVIVMRRREFWEVPTSCSVVYSGPAARAAHLSLNTNGGRQIRDLLLREIGERRLTRG